MNHKLTNYILAQDKKNKKDKNKKKKDDAKRGKDSDEEKKKSKKEKKEKKAKKEKKSKKDKSDKKEASISNNEDAGDEEKDYLKEAMFGKKENDVLDDNSDSDEVASEAGVDDEGAMGKFIEIYVGREQPID